VRRVIDSALFGRRREWAVRSTSPPADRSLYRVL